MITTGIIGVCIGGGIGALIGRQRSCESGACPLTANPWRGAIFGALIGLLTVLSFTAAEQAEQPTSSAIMEGGNTAGGALPEDLIHSGASLQGTMIVDFWAPWCAPCKEQMPILNQLKQSRTHVRVLKIDITKKQELAQSWRVTAVPTLVFLQDGKEVGRLRGLQSLAVLERAVDTFGRHAAMKSE